LTPPRFSIAGVVVGPTVNSRVELTDEYTVYLASGDCGRGSSPLGETCSRFESRAVTFSACEVVRQLHADDVIGREITQEEFDGYLARNAARFGSAAVFSLSVAFFEASLCHVAPSWPTRLPRFSLNILNGGRHAYTNPVLSDFHEYLLVPRHDDIEQLMIDHGAIQASVRNALAQRETTRIAGNAVHVIGRRGNRDCIEFLLDIVEGLALSGKYDLMIDAAAAQRWNGSAYELELAEGQTFSPDELQHYWRELIRDYPVRYLEDPFAEDDIEHWQGLVDRVEGCCVLGDDVHSGDVGRIRSLLDSGCMTGIVFKPDQAGTISASLAGLAAAREANVPRFLSHRSISTDSVVLAHLLLRDGVEFAKFGPLCSDFSAVQKMNEVLRQARAASNTNDVTNLSGQQAHG
jgi:enolase